LFSNDEMASDFNYALSVGSILVLRGRRDPGRDVRDFRSGVEKAVAKLRSIHRQLELIPEAPEIVPEANVRRTAGAADGSVFVVHGHDGEAKQTLARFLEKLGLSTVILHEQADRGRTIIEKFEHHAAVGFAVVLLTPDDLGASKDDASNLIWNDPVKPARW
jgi:predicted nucleotide-binding protein